METVSSKKRGRPSVYDRDGMQTLREFNKSQFSEMGARSLSNLYYVQTGQQLAIDCYGDQRARQIFTRSSGRMRRQCVLEQIGRLYQQERATADECRDVLRCAVDLLGEGYTVRQVQEAIREHRKQYE